MKKRMYSYAVPALDQRLEECLKEFMLCQEAPFNLFDWRDELIGKGETSSLVTVDQIHHGVLMPLLKSRRIRRNGVASFSIDGIKVPQWVTN